MPVPGAESGYPARARIGATHLDLASRARVDDRFEAALTGESPPLVVVSANLDHLHHFANPGRHGSLPGGMAADGTEWLTLIDGHPFAAAVRRKWGEEAAELHPGSDMLPSILALADRKGARVAVIGGTEETRLAWSRTLASTYPGVVDAGGRWVDFDWLDRPGSGADLAAWVADRNADVVVVGLGKPRQEVWLRDHGGATGAKLMLAFGSAAEYVAGTTTRAPGWARRHGLEWAVRLRREPRRLWRRYLVTGPGAWIMLRRDLTEDAS